MKLVKLPGMIDIHTHLRDPGATHKEDFYTGTASALKGGVTMILDMPNNPFPTISPQALKEKEKIAQKKAVCDYGFIFGASQKDNTHHFKKVIPKVAALKIYLDQTTGTLLVQKLALLEKIFQNWQSDKPIMVHAEENTLAKAIALAHLYKRHLHCCHISLKEEVELIKKAKEQGVKITAEVTPHHLFLTKDNQKKLGPFAFMKPPLRHQKDVDSLWQGIKKGIIDIIATDHAPHLKKEKQNKKPAFGVPGLETALPLLLTAVKERKIPLEKVIELYHQKPKQIFKLPNQPNTYLFIDLNKKWTIKNEDLKTKCGWSPFAGWSVYGKVHQVILRGKIVYKDGIIKVPAGFGHNIYS